VTNLKNKKQKIKKMDKNGLKIVYKNNKAYGIRNSVGFLFFFSNISHWSGQDERYRQEVEEQLELADFLLKCLKEADPKIVLDAKTQGGLK
jgi:hypothetical protein